MRLSRRLRLVFLTGKKMKIVDLKTGKTAESLPGKCVLALGNFDGVHIGHAKLIKLTAEKAKEEGLTPAVWTFDPDSLSRFRAGSERRLLSRAEKDRIFASYGAEYAVYEDFNRVRDMSPDEFVKNVLVGSLGCALAVCGFNFTFGRGGAGGPDLLKKLMEEYGGGAVIVPPVRVNGVVVSSSGARSLIEEGRVDEARVLLGRPYSVTLPVKEGKKLGRTLGIPTVNQTFDGLYVRPGNGIYATSVSVDGKEYCGVTNVGSRPTVNTDPADVNCETHIIGYDGWLYGNEVGISFFKKLRDEKKFADLDELKRAIELDEKKALAFFKTESEKDKEKE